MSHPILAILRSEQGKFGKRIGALYLFLLASNVGAWVWAFIAFHDHPLLINTSLLAWSFGLRHAVDADHIAAIDNATRKLMEEGKRPIAVGFMFSLGHSTIVLLASAAIATTAMAFKTEIASFKEVGGLIGTLVSTAFLLVLALLNLMILFQVIGKFRGNRQVETYREGRFDGLFDGRGLMARICRPLFRLITKSWQMYFLGLLFGLGFDTATEVGLLGISAASAAHGMPIWSIMVFPLLFMAAMTLVDTTDGVLMLGAYGWAFVKPARKLYYNLTVTSVSVLVALLVGAVEGLGLLSERLRLSGMFWDAIGCLNDNFTAVGYSIVGVFAASCLVSAVMYRWLCCDDIDIAAERS